MEGRRGGGRREVKKRERKREGREKEGRSWMGGGSAKDRSEELQFSSHFSVCQRVFSRW